MEETLSMAPGDCCIYYVEPALKIHHEPEDPKS